ncbi:MAG TPA: hypothetical protein DEF45_19010 [Rhodopirellula sp.]|nr:hypothetical protein [Rhodopirellula sp.]
MGRVHDPQTIFLLIGGLEIQNPSASVRNAANLHPGYSFPAYLQCRETSPPLRRGGAVRKPNQKAGILSYADLEQLASYLAAVRIDLVVNGITREIHRTHRSSSLPAMNAAMADTCTGKKE